MTYREFLLELTKIVGEMGKNAHFSAENAHFSAENAPNITNNNTNNTYPRNSKSNIAGEAKFHNQQKNKVSTETSEVGLVNIGDANLSGQNCFSISVKQRDNCIAKNQTVEGKLNSKVDNKKQSKNGDIFRQKNQSKIAAQPPAPPKIENPEKTAILEQPDKIIEEGEESRTQSKCATNTGSENADNMLNHNHNLSDEEKRQVWREMEQELEAELRGEYIPKNKDELVWQHSVFEDYDVQAEIDSHYNIIKEAFNALPKRFEKHSFTEPKKKLPPCYFNEDEISIMKMQYEDSFKDFRDIYRRKTTMMTDFIDKNDILKVGEKVGEKVGIFSRKVGEKVGEKVGDIVHLNFYQKGLLQYKVSMPFYLSKCDFQKNGLYMPTKMLDNEYIKRIINLNGYGNVVKQILSMFAGHVVLLGNYSFSDYNNSLKYFDEDLRIIEQGIIGDKAIIDACILRMMCPRRQSYLGLKKLKFNNKQITRYDGYLHPLFYFELSNRNIYVYRYMLQKAIKTFDTVSGINLDVVIEFSKELENLDKKIKKS